MKKNSIFYKACSYVLVLTLVFGLMPDTAMAEVLTENAGSSTTDISETFEATPEEIKEAPTVLREI